jgi:hypothetical protein
MLTWMVLHLGVLGHAPDAPALEDQCEAGGLWAHASCERAHAERRVFCPLRTQLIDRALTRPAVGSL